MGVISTGAIFKTLTFDGRSSSEFNVYITGEGVFNAPERAVEMISIPGRNGAFALDYGRFENIEVTYNCGIAGDDDADFASAISDFRNWLCSRNGYVRLSDDYNAGEYRQAIYKSGLEVTAENLKAGEFPVVFECKPQRFLTSGETAVSITSGDTITNPTLFDSRPMLEITGYGNIDIGTDEIEIHNEPIGDVVVFPATTNPTAAAWTIPIETQFANNGDQIRITTSNYNVVWTIASGTVSSYSVTSVGPGSAGAIIAAEQFQPVVINKATFHYGTSGSQTTTGTFDIVTSNYGTLTAVIAVTLSYNGTDTITFSHSATRPTQFSSASPRKYITDVILSSTQTTLGNPIYLDLDIGEAYKIENDVPVSVNNGVVMPAELPTLTPGANTITYDNTITQLDIVPRWFKI